jgi:hypothetical protein
MSHDQQGLLYRCILLIRWDGEGRASEVERLGNVSIKTFLDALASDSLVGHGNQLEGCVGIKGCEEGR